MVNEHEPKEEELDKLLLLLSQPLTRLILSVLAGLDPSPDDNRVQASLDLSDDGFMKDELD